MKSISLYVDRQSFLHRIDPISKIYYIVAAILVPILYPSLTVAFAVMVISLILLFLGKVIRQTLSVYGFVFLVLITVLIIQTLFYPGNETPAYRIGQIVLYREGFLYALTISFRVINIVTSFLILVFTTKPADLVESLVRKGLSPRFGYVIASVFQIVPEMMSAMGRITDAQRSRGMEAEGKLSVRMKAFLPLIGPVVLSSLLNVKERALALEVRGFNAKGKKTFLNEEKNFLAPTVVQWSLLAVILIAIIWRIIQ